MKANELRIGNWYDQFSNNHKATWATLKQLDEAPKSQLWCKPIPLTKEWLLKFGLVNHPNDIPTYGKFFGDFDDDDYGYFFCVYQDLGGNFYTQIIGRKIILNSVHQLQNLYFAIAEEELIQVIK
jgi:hypothetical protein